MIIDDTRLNWRDAAVLRKQGVDAYLGQYQQGPKPRINVDALVFALVLFAATAVIFYLIGYDDGETDAKSKPVRIEHVSPPTKCTSFDWGGPGGQKRCITWRRVL